VPDLQTLEDITQQPIPNETVLNYELWALKKMGWRLNARTPLAFVASYIVVDVTTAADVCWDTARASPYTREALATRIGDELYAMASFTLLEAQLKQYKASDLAAAMLFFVRRALGVQPVWPPELTAMTSCNLAHPTGAHSREVADLVGVYDRLLLPPAPAPGARGASEGSALDASAPPTSPPSAPALSTPVAALRSSRDRSLASPSAAATAQAVDAATLDAAIQALSAASLSPAGPAALAAELSPPVDDAKERNKENVPFDRPRAMESLDGAAH